MADAELRRSSNKNEGEIYGHCPTSAPPRGLLETIKIIKAENKSNYNKNN
jgi:hypothetical protein